MQLLHYILKCNYFGMTTVSFFFLFVKSFSIPDDELFSETYVGVTLHTLSKLYDVPVGCVTHPPLWGNALLYLRSPKNGWCSLSDALSCSWIKARYPFCILILFDRLRLNVTCQNLVNYRFTNLFPMESVILFLWWSRLQSKIEKVSRDVRKA